MLELSDNPTTQEAYEYIRAYFSRPDAMLAKSDEGCRYRTDQGDKCAVGCLIPDKWYDMDLSPEYEDEPRTLGERMEENPVDEIIDMDPRLRTLLNGDDEEGQRKLRFLGQAQKAHDQFAIDAAHFVSLLDGIALATDLVLLRAHLG